MVHADHANRARGWLDASGVHTALAKDEEGLQKTNREW